MTLTDLSTLILDQAEFRKAFIKSNDVRVYDGGTNADGTKRDDVSTEPKNELHKLLNGTFTIGRMPFIHVSTLDNGAQIRIKFYDTVATVLNSKGKEIPGKESYLSYMEVTVAPVGVKAYMFTTDVRKVAWKMARATALVEHKKYVARLVTEAQVLGIDLSSQTAWCTMYNESI